MNKKLLFSIFAMFGFSFFFSCSKKSVSVPSFTSSMSANINSVSWTALTVAGTSNAGILIVSGLSTDGSSISMELPANTVPGTYNITAGETTYVIGYSLGQSASTMSIGTLVISSNASNQISGTFNGTLTDPISSATVPLINGAFSAKYQ